MTKLLQEYMTELWQEHMTKLWQEYMTELWQEHMTKLLQEYMTEVWQEHMSYDRSVTGTNDRGVKEHMM